MAQSQGLVIFRFSFLIKYRLMGRMERLFINKKKEILSVYFTAGYPQLNDTLSIIQELDRSGVDMIEIGIPFSDPVADGPVIQKSSEKALSNGMTIKLLFEQLIKVREITGVPLILMGYVNPILKFGMERFLSKCQETGIDGTIIPDLPVEEYLLPFKELFDRHEIRNIFLLSPQTPVERIKYLDSVSNGFLYMVSKAATTGAVNNFDTAQINYFKKVDSLKLKTPRLIGFGISNRETFIQACNYANGAIIGSSFIKALDGDGKLPEKINRYVLKLLN
jgi:tryptophan synthase alpha chain